MWAAAEGPRARCGSGERKIVRPGLWPGTTRWLRWGGGWRPAAGGCARCGSQHPGGMSWYVSTAPPRRGTLPLRVVRELWRTVARERTAAPAPWLYLASAAAGGTVGIGIGIGVGGPGQSRRSALRVAIGVGVGLVGCWSVFASTALRHSYTWVELRDGVLQQVAPDRAARLRRRHDDEVSRSVMFPVYGLSSSWAGTRHLVGSSQSRGPSDRRLVATSLTLGHGAQRPGGGAWVEVETAADLAGNLVHHDEEHLATVLWDDVTDDEARDRARGTSAAEQDLPGLVADRAEARVLRPEPRWQERALQVDSRDVPARWLGYGEHWVAYTVVDGLHLLVRARQMPSREVSLVRVADLDDYPARWY